ncbi:MAG: Do family serine endopeptidase [Rhodobacterales bacterium]|nr:Do family serine endopeptidase [Rhodobacterales bacterium]
MKNIFRPGYCAPAVLAAALASTGAVALAPTAVLAVPAGGYADLVGTLSPSVVYIEVTSSASPKDASMDLPEGIPEELRRHFEDLRPDAGEPQMRQGVGSGFIISKDGRIVTNSHVVDGADKVTVKLADGRSFVADVIGSDPMTDIALLQVKTGEDLPAVAFGDSSEMRPGDEVIAVGNPFGLGGTVTSGIVSATSRNINSGPYDDFIQTDAAINRGNSGGPLFNADGKVIGVNTAIFSPDGGSVGIGFAVPSDMVQRIVDDLADDGSITRGWLGVQIKPMSQEIASVLGYDTARGAVVETVFDDSPAKAAGLQQGDIILAFNDTKITEMRDLTRAVAQTAPDADAKLKVLRGGSEKTIDLTIGTLEPGKA